MFVEIFKRIKFWNSADRIGPDIPTTHWKLFFRSTMLKLCKKKFLFFSNTAEIRPGSYIIGCSQISIGDNVVIRPHVQMHGETSSLSESISIEDNVLVGCGVHFYVENHKFDNPDLDIICQGHSLAKPILIQKGSWIGANAIILPGVTIGRNTVVAAGSVVTKSFGPNLVIGGVPARIIKKIV
ncbi:acyltransferase [Petrimonas sp.]|uniref:acyltransferase n=1 Tax=Petrimonas sp. TaxID=2023866 RepID=UPI003F5142B6